MNRQHKKILIRDFAQSLYLPLAIKYHQDDRNMDEKKKFAVDQLF